MASCSAFFLASLAALSRMISLGPLICGEPVGAGAAAIRELPAPLFTPLRPPPLPLKRSDMEARSSTRSGVNGLGCLRASSRAYKTADAVCFEIRGAGCGREVGTFPCADSPWRSGARGVESPSNEDEKSGRRSFWCRFAKVTLGGLGMPTDAASM